MAKKAKEKRPDMNEMVEFGIGCVLRALGKGEDLRGAVWAIVNASAHWGVENHKERQDKLRQERQPEYRPGNDPYD